MCGRSRAHSRRSGAAMAAVASRASRERGAATAARNPKGQYSLRSACPIAAKSAATPRATSCAATVPWISTIDSRRASRPLATPSVPVASSGWRVAQAAVTARFQGDTRTGARRPGCRASRATADVPYSSRLRAQLPQAAGGSCRTTTLGSNRTRYPRSAVRHTRSTSSPRRSSSSKPLSTSASRRTRIAADGRNPSLAPGLTSAG